jgi:glutamine synthetase
MPPTIPEPNLESVATWISEQDVHEVECIFADISGYPRGKLMPADRFAQGAELRICQAIPMQAITGDYSYDPVFPDEDPDVRLQPDYASVRLAPWASRKRALAIHDCLELSGENSPFASRNVLRQVLQRYSALGLTPVVAPELEFYLCAISDDPTRALQCAPMPDGRSEVGQSAFSMNMLNAFAPFWDEFRAALQTLGVRADTWIHELGSGQYEINLVHGNALALADQTFLLKYAAKELAPKHGLQAVFMAKPIAGAAGSSMHLHSSVVDANGLNIFSKEDGTESPAFGHFLAGLQTYLPDLMLMLAPNVNSYRRYVSGSLAPINLQWGYENRTTGLRVPQSTAAARRIENRLAGADANPYLALAAHLGAGLQGLQGQLAHMPAVSGNAYVHAHSLPCSLDSAIERMQHSTQAREFFGDLFVTGFCAVKTLESQSYRNEISTWERRYLLAQV